MEELDRRYLALCGGALCGGARDRSKIGRK